MWIVRIALQRPYTFIVLALLIVLLGVFAILRTPVDIFPVIRIPVVAVVWKYSGLSPQDMAQRIVGFSERVASTTVNDIEHTESLSLDGTGLVKYFFQPHVNEDLALSQINSISQTLLRLTPPGTSSPFILAYDASSVPILNLALSSPSMSEADIFDFGNSFIRTQLATVAGAALPYPYGGAIRQIQVDIDPQKMRARGLTAQDVSNAIGAQNLILPAGTQKIGGFEYFVNLNASPRVLEELNDLPIRADRNGAMIYVRDVAQVHNGSAPQTNIVRVDGHRAVLMSVLKTGSASTLAVVSGIKHLLPQIRAEMPPGMSVEAIGDQSLFVRAAVAGVIREGVIAAALTGLMILLFLGSWRSTLIITISIPLSVLASIVCLSMLGETINIMTLGGLALAVGILVDDATVTIENMNWHLEQGKDVETAILDGARQIALPALVSTLSICIVFIPMFFLGGIAKYLFVPLAEAVVFAMLASYLLSRTLVPTLAKYWLRAQAALHDPERRRNRLMRWQHGFEQRFAAFRARYHALLAAALTRPVAFAAVFMAAGAASYGLAPFLGEDFFPSVDSGQIRLHLRARSGTRIEDTAPLCDAVEAEIRKIIPVRELVSVVDNIGVPNSGINLAYSTSAPVGPGDADIMLTLAPNHHSSADYVRILRRELPRRFPGVTFSFPPADIVSQILNFGLPAPFDVQISGFDLAGNRAFAETLLPKLRRIPGAVDLRLQQTFNYPQLDVEVNRTRAAQLGLSQYDVASDLLISLSGSFQTAPSFWADPKTGVQYNVVVQAPQYALHSLQDLLNLPIGNGANGGAGGADPPQILSNLASVSRSAGPEVVTHYNARPTLDIYGAVQDTDLGSVARAVHRIVSESASRLPRGSQVAIRGQAETMTASFGGLLLGLIGAIVLIYLLIVVNFQSWLDPFIIITALPAALSGIVWMLFLTGTTLSVPALTGAIMCMGVATANSILVVSFARERMREGQTAAEAALQAGFTRFRPVLMTALAMIVGMVPMALGLGEGGEQNAPLGRAVIGGLLFATVATLFFVPVVFSLIHGRRDHAKLP
ncbi:MAG: efflux RND transporter permease subunit [Nevskia sp.]|nr:efflux RND transporter permease subunit [Nevskia sp.]